MLLTTSDGELIISASTHLLSPLRAYNVTVGDTHTYTVGVEGIWVHNACELSKLPWKKGKLKEHFDKHGDDFGVNSSKKYGELAEKFAKNNDKSILQTINGDYICRFDPKSNTVLVVSASGGKIKTFYKWDGRSNDAVVEAFRQLML